MINTNVHSDHAPERVEIEVLSGSRYVMLRDRIRQETRVIDGAETTEWVYDEAAFTSHEALTVDGAAAEFDAWWSFAAGNDTDDAPVSDSAAAGRAGGRGGRAAAGR